MERDIMSQSVTWSVRAGPGRAGPGRTGAKIIRNQLDFPIMFDGWSAFDELYNVGKLGFREFKRFKHYENSVLLAKVRSAPGLCASPAQKK